MKSAPPNTAVESLVAWALAAVVPVFWWKAQSSDAPRAVKLLAHGLLATLAIQISLGIATLLQAVPVALGAAHQGGALVVFTVALMLNHRLQTPPGRAAEHPGRQSA